MIKSIYLKIYRWTTVGFFSVITILLFLIGLYGTCFFVAPTEITAFQKDNIWLNILMLTGFLVLVYICYKSKKICSIAEIINENQQLYKRIRLVILCIYAFLGFMFVLGTQYAPRADQESVLQAAFELKLDYYNLWQKGNYMEMYPNQNGIVLILYIFSLIFGDKNSLAFQLINVAALIFLLKQMMDMTGMLGATKVGQLFVGIIQIIYCPLIFYAYFVYGNIIGLALSMFAIQAEWKYFDTGRKKYILQAAIGIALAVMIKNNYLIFMLGMLIFALSEIIKKKQWRGFILLLCILTAFCGQHFGTRLLMEYKTGQKLDGGASSLAWIAMGMQEGYLAEGWYNGYIPISYAEAGYDKAIHTDMCSNEIKDRINYFMDNKELLPRFIYRKTASQWNNPSFQAMCISQGCSSNIIPNKVITWIMSETGSHSLTVFWSILQMLILLGTILFLIARCHRDAEEKSFVFLLIFVGGFLFHLIWEAKAQYTLPYFTLLVPLSVIGFQKAYKKFHNKITKTA